MLRRSLVMLAAAMVAGACDGSRVAQGVGTGLRADGQSINNTCEKPDWSPDGTRIAFSHLEMAHPSDPDADSELKLYVVGADGGGMTVLAGEVRAGEDVQLGDRVDPIFPKWSPDGSQVIFQALTFWTEDNPDTDAEEDWTLALHIVDVDSREVRPLLKESMHGIGGSWSPDGSRIVFAKVLRTGPHKDQLDLWEIDVVTGVERQLTSDTQDEFRPVYSPDGSKILFGSVPEGVGPADPASRDSIWIMSADGSDKRLFVDTDEEQRDPEWSPDGRLVALTLGEHTQTRLAIVPAEGGAPKVIASAEPPFLLSPRDATWSPDGSKIAFCGDGEARFGLYVMNADGSGKRGIVPFVAAADVGK